MTDPVLQQWAAEGRLVSVCPEVAGGLPVPRPAAEIQRPFDVAQGRILVLTRNRHDVTDVYVIGAEHAVELARLERIRTAILKDGSPSCGSGVVYDGTFTGTRIPGRGVTAAALEAAGVRVFSETQIQEAAAWVTELEQAS